MPETERIPLSPLAKGRAIRIQCLIGLGLRDHKPRVTLHEMDLPFKGLGVEILIRFPGDHKLLYSWTAEGLEKLANVHVAAESIIRSALNEIEKHEAECGCKLAEEPQ